MYYGVSYHMFAFLFERTSLVIHCKTRLWSLLLTLIGSWTAPSLWSRYSISFRCIFYFIFLLLCFTLVVDFGACYWHKFLVGDFLVQLLPSYFYRSILFRAFPGLLLDIPTGCVTFCDYHDAVASQSYLWILKVWLVFII